MPAVEEYETIASFCEARLVRHLNGRLEILGGTPDDRRQAEAWIDRFLRPAQGSSGWRSE